MVKVKSFLLGLDWICLSVSGYSFIDISSNILAGNLAMSSIDNFIKLLLSMAGFIYLCARTYHYIMKSSIERELLREDVIAKQHENHKHNTFGQFKESLKNIDHENLKP